MYIKLPRLVFESFILACFLYYLYPILDRLVLGNNDILIDQDVTIVIFLFKLRAYLAAIEFVYYLISNKEKIKIKRREA